MTKNKKDNSNTIALNKKARHDYFIEQSLEAGLSLQGWEVKSLRENKVQIKESYVILKNNELYLFGAHISPLNSVSSHVDPDSTRTRKLLLHRLEIDRLREKITQKGFTVVPLKLYWARGKVKIEIGRSEEHTSELQSRTNLVCRLLLEKKKKKKTKKKKKKKKTC